MAVGENGIEEVADRVQVRVRAHERGRLVLLLSHDLNHKVAGRPAGIVITSSNLCDCSPTVMSRLSHAIEV